MHPLLFAIGSERYTPYTDVKQPTELLTIANRILGTGQQLAQIFVLRLRINNRSTRITKLNFDLYSGAYGFATDIHFHTHTTIDTLDYSGTGLNSGSKVVMAAYGDKIRELCKDAGIVENIRGYDNPQLIMPGIVSIQTSAFTTYEDTAGEMKEFTDLCRSVGTRILPDDYRV